MKIAINFAVILEGDELDAVIEYAKTVGYDYDSKGGQGRRAFNAENRALIQRFLEDYGKNGIKKAKEWYESPEGRGYDQG